MVESRTENLPYKLIAESHEFKIVNWSTDYA